MPIRKDFRAGVQDHGEIGMESLPDEGSNMIRLIESLNYRCLRYVCVGTGELNK